MIKQVVVLEAIGQLKYMYICIYHIKKDIVI